MCRLAPLALLAASATAAAEPVGLATRPRRVEPVRVEPAPRAVPEDPGPDPDRASGVVTEDEPSSASRARWVPRALLFLPKIVLWGALQPVRGAVYLAERDGAGSQRFGASKDGPTFGGSLVGSYQSDLGGVIGGRLQVKNLFGADERLRVRADGGTAIRYGFGARLTTGERLSPVRLSLDADLEKHPHDRFYGIGNGPAMEASFEQLVARGGATVEIEAVDHLTLQVSTIGTRRDLEAPDASAVPSVDLRYVYVETAASYDTRRPTSVLPTQTLDAAGWLARLRTRVARGTGDDPTRYVGYGGELERDFDLRSGTRTLALRLVADGIAGEADRIPFTDLPSLGGPDYLRGYPSGRFRDRAAVVSTVEYAWRLFNHASGYLFVDAGKPAASWMRLDEGPLRVGVGGGVLVHTKHTSFARAQLAFSRDGDVNVSLAFQPTSGRRERARRE